VRQLPAGKNVSTEVEDIVGIRHQAATCKNTVDWKDLCAVVTCRVCELALAP
jgi:hypothetical protein